MHWRFQFVPNGCFPRETVERVFSSFLSIDKDRFFDVRCCPFSFSSLRSIEDQCRSLRSLDVHLSNPKESFPKDRQPKFSFDGKSFFLDSSNHRMSKGSSSSGMFTNLSRSDDETLILNRPSSKKNFPMGETRTLGKCTRITENLRPVQTQQTREFNETKIVTLQTDNQHSRTEERRTNNAQR